LRDREEHAWRLGTPELRSGWCSSLRPNHDEAFETLRQHEEYARLMQQAVRHGLLRRDPASYRPEALDSLVSL
jgi:hypothetical protein